MPGDRARHDQPGRPEETRLASRCAWCGRFATEQDRQDYENGAVASDGICDECEERHFGSRSAA